MADDGDIGRPPCRPVRILYVEDRPEIRAVVEMLCERLGRDVSLAADGVEGLQKLSERPHDFDLLLTDHQMPRLNGLGLVRQARELGFAGKMAVLSSGLSQADISSYLKAGVTLILTKPILPLEFDAALRQLFPPEGDGVSPRREIDGNYSGVYPGARAGISR